MSRQIGRRLPPQANEIIGRTGTVRFTFNGKDYAAHPGDTIASALAANGVDVIGRSFKYHRPRGLFGYGHDVNSMVQIDNEVSVSAWLREIENGMDVRSINVWPSVERDVMSLTGLADRFLPVGFYYKTFIRPKFLWPTYEKVLRQLAGLGKLNIDAPLVAGYDKQYVHGDVVIVGGGPAGMQAALSVAEQGARVVLFDDQSVLGGHLRHSSDNQTELAQLRRAVHESPFITVYSNTLVQGWFDQQWLAAVCGKRLYKIRGKAVIFATGAEEQPPIFGNNDLPGVMLGSAMRRLLHEYSVAVGQNVVVVTANDEGWRLSAELLNAGIRISAIADQRPEHETDAIAQVRQTNTPIHWQHTIASADGKKRVERVHFAPIKPDGTVMLDATWSRPCDAVALSTAFAPINGLLYQAGATIAYNENRHEFLPQALPAGIFVAGRVAGTHDLALQLAEAKLAGEQAAAHCGFCDPPKPQQRAAITRKKNREPIRTSTLNHIKGDGKRFVDFDEDVTDKDVETAIAEGYHSIELLKRYSTISMGPSQGKWSSVNTIHLTSRINDDTIPATGTTTSRPPTRPLEMGALAGQMLEPVRVSPIHQWHLAHGAKMMNTGLWKRPEHFGDPIAEVNAVRQRVGLIDVSTLGKIKLTGAGVPALLDRLYTNRWRKLRVGRVRYGIMCTAEGVVMDDGVTARVGEREWYMSTTSSGAGNVYEWIQWWVQSGWGDGVHVASVSENYAAFNLAGPRSRAVLAQLTNASISNAEFPYMHVRQFDVAGVPCRVMRIGFTGELSFEIHVPSGYGLHVWEQLMAAGEQFGIRPFGLEAQRVLRLEKAHIIVGQDTDALADPISADLAPLVKLTKPDFLGQRALQRIAENGIKQRLVGFKMADRTIVPEEGLQIVREVPKSEMHPIGLEIIGWVTSSRYSPTIDEAIGLCWLSADLASRAGNPFTIRRNGKLLKAYVHHGAFVDPKGERLRS